MKYFNWIFSNLKTTLLLTVIACTLILIFPKFASGEDSGNVGVTYNQVVDERSGGISGKYDFTGDPFSFEIDGQLQAGDAYRGKVYGEILFKTSSVGIKLITDFTAQGYQLEDIGRSGTAAIALNVPTGDLSIDIGIGGNNAAPWGEPNAFDTLVSEGFGEGSIEGLGLETINRKSTGLPFRDGNFVQFFVATELEKNHIDIDLKAIFEVFGEDTAQQFHAGFQTSRKFGRLDVTGRIEVGLMAYEEIIYHQTATLLTFGTNW